MVDERLKYSLTFTQAQIEPIQHIADRLGLTIAATLRHLVYKSLENSLALNSLSDQADFVYQFFNGMNDTLKKEFETGVGLSNTPTGGKNFTKTEETEEKTDPENPVIPFEDLTP